MPAAPTAPTTPTAPSPSPPPPTRIVVNASLTNTITGAPIGSALQQVDRIPAQLAFSSPGFITRDTWVLTAGPTVDLIPEAGFDLPFYRQLARGALDGRMDGLRVLPAAPAFFVETEGSKGLSASAVARLERVARRTVADLTGGRFQLATWQTGPAARPLAAGWIVVERTDLGGNVCGRAIIGASAGHIELDSDTACNMEAVFAHELGHALGFWHVDRPGALMFPQQRFSNVADAASELERYHARIAYARPRGNRDPDEDTESSSVTAAPMAVD